MHLGYAWGFKKYGAASPLFIILRCVKLYGAAMLQLMPCGRQTIRPKHLTQKCDSERLEFQLIIQSHAGSALLIMYCCLIMRGLQTGFE